MSLKESRSASTAAMSCSNTSPASRAAAASASSCSMIGRSRVISLVRSGSRATSSGCRSSGSKSSGLMSSGVSSLIAAASLLVDDLGVDDLVVVAGSAAVAGLAARRRAGRVLLRRALVELLAERLAGGHEPFVRGADGVDVVAVQRRLELVERALHGGLLGVVDALGVVAQHLLHLVHERVGVVADLGLFTALAVLLGVGLGVLDHLVDVALVERALTGDGHALLLAGGPVLGGHVHDAVGVDVERDLDLGHPARRRREVDELELAQRLV